MYAPNACRKCGGTNTVMLLFGIVCNTCEPAPVKAIAPVKDPSKEPVTHHYGWIRSDYVFGDRAALHGKWAYVYPTHLAARSTGRGGYILRVKTVHPIPADGTGKFRIWGYPDALLRQRNGEFFKPKDSGFGADEVGFLNVVPESEGT